LARREVSGYPAAMRWLCLLAVVVAAGCGLPPSPAERLAFTAHELNSAMRFGHLGLALDRVSEDEREDYARRHASWHRELRIVDVEVLGVQMLTPFTAEVQVGIGWHRQNETTMRTTTLAQKWTQGKDGWELSEELRSGGAPGLFPIPKKSRKRRPGVTAQTITTDAWQ
jgi:hypothetical protein